ncbi:P-loop containing nucleoside triphosphate protein [Pleurostoma richardsiae]|uniref:P-loop containing nucleoside triphosphate protein n=1 Tax=Pleurostoma richardsiae TaxID=41990 RepID=A0AA38VVL4_9PEZI|nr:P-loop containing nucleoside triphosphate protein [Pleurostoma richardsiae]
MGAHQPYLYQAEKYDDARFPTTSFDPKAVTRASYAPKPERPKHEGPLVSLNRHPDAHEVLGQRKPYRVLGARSKQWIKRMRKVQLALRVLEFIGAAGILVLMILISHVNGLTAWVMRITAGVVMGLCLYAIYHLSRHAGGRTPGSSGAYHLFAGFSDLATMPLYAFGALAAHNQSDDWRTLLSTESLLTDYFIPALYYTLIGAGGLHLLSLATSLWLGLKFRQITLMPPDMNPLEDRLTSRQHKKNKSSVATTVSVAESERRLSTPLEARRRSGMPYEDLSRPPTVPFMATRSSGSRDSSSSKRDSRHDLPSRQYQIVPSNASPRSSAGASSDLKRMSGPPPPATGRSSWRGSYAEIPLREPEAEGSRASTGTVESRVTISTPERTPPQPRAARFSEAWYASESLINRTQERNRALAKLTAAQGRKPAAYEAVSQRYDYPGPEDSDSESDDSIARAGGNYTYDENAAGAGDLGLHHPNPLASNPLSAPPPPPQAGTPLRASALSEVSLNDRRVSGDIADASRDQSKAGADGKGRSLLGVPGKRSTWAPRDRNSSIQADDAFYSKPYGSLKPATPPVMIGGGSAGGGRQVSSGNDYDIGSGRFSAYARRNVSGKVAEEGRSRYSMLNDD